MYIHIYIYMSLISFLCFFVYLYMCLLIWFLLGGEGGRVVFSPYNHPKVHIKPNSPS